MIPSHQSYLSAASPHHTRGSAAAPHPAVLPEVSNDPPEVDAALDVSIDTADSAGSLEVSPLDLVVSANPNIDPSGHVMIDELVNKGFGSTDGHAPIDEQAIKTVLAVVMQSEGRRRMQETATRLLSDPQGPFKDVTMSNLASLLRGMSLADIAAIPFSAKKTKAVYQRWLFELMGANREEFTDGQFKTKAKLTGAISADQVIQAVAYLVCLALISAAYCQHTAPVVRSNDVRFQILEAQMARTDESLSKIMELLQQRSSRPPNQRGNAPRSRPPSTPGNPVHSPFPSHHVAMSSSPGLSDEADDDGSDVSGSSADVTPPRTPPCPSRHSDLDAVQMANLLVGPRQYIRRVGEQGSVDHVDIPYEVVSKAARMIAKNLLPACDDGVYYPVGGGKNENSYGNYYVTRASSFGLSFAFTAPRIPSRYAEINAANTEAVLQGTDPRAFQILLNFLAQKHSSIVNRHGGVLYARIEARLVMAYFLIRLIFVHHKIEPTQANCKQIWEKVFPATDRQLNDPWASAEEVFNAFIILRYVCVRHNLHMPCSRCAPSPLSIAPAKSTKLLTDVGWKAYKEAEAAAAPLKITAQEFIALAGNSKFKTKQPVPAAPTTVNAPLSYYLTAAGQNFCLPV